MSHSNALRPRQHVPLGHPRCVVSMSASQFLGNQCHSAIKVVDNLEFYIYSELFIWNCSQVGADKRVKFQVTSDPPNQFCVTAVFS